MAVANAVYVVDGYVYVYVVVAAAAVCAVIGAVVDISVAVDAFASGGGEHSIHTP